MWDVSVGTYLPWGFFRIAFLLELILDIRSMDSTSFASRPPPAAAEVASAVLAISSLGRGPVSNLKYLCYNK